MYLILGQMLWAVQRCWTNLWKLLYIWHNQENNGLPLHTLPTDKCFSSVSTNWWIGNEISETSSIVGRNPDWITSSRSTQAVSRIVDAVLIPLTSNPRVSSRLQTCSREYGDTRLLTGLFTVIAKSWPWNIPVQYRMLFNVDERFLFRSTLAYKIWTSKNETIQMLDENVKLFQHVSEDFSFTHNKNNHHQSRSLSIFPKICSSMGQIEHHNICI